MKVILKIIVIPIVVLFGQSCFVNKAFVPTSYEPCLHEKKGDKNIGFSISPFNLLKLNYSIATSNKFGFSCAGSVYEGFTSISLHGLYYKSTVDYKFDLSLGCEFSSHTNNTSTKGYFFRRNSTSYGINNAFYSPYLASSFLLKDDRNHYFGLSLKGCYNLVDHYSYSTKHINSDEVTSERYTFTERPYPFVSLEGALQFFSIHNKFAFRLQCGYNYRYASLEYSYNEIDYYTGDKVEKSALHPTLNAICANFGWTFFIGRKKKENKEIEN